MSPLLAQGAWPVCPPAIVAVCEFDPLRDQGASPTPKRSPRPGWPTEKLYFAGHIHGFMSLAAMVPSARALPRTSSCGPSAAPCTAE